jgi:catechol 2,3-dioxygenase-like lactoylglutathione lyase family enzyme
MIGYITVGTNNIERAAEYYDVLFATLGAARAFDTDTFIAWTTGPTAPAFAVAKPFDGNPATVGNGVMVAIAMDTKEKVDAFYAKALELGGTDEGPPGMRLDNFYAGYFRDPEGNKLNAFCFVRE